METLERENLNLQSCALLEAVRIFGSVAVIADTVGANRTQVSNWINAVKKSDQQLHRIRIPYHFAIQLSYLTGIDITRFVPDIEYHQANTLFTSLSAKKVLQVKQIAIKSIYVDFESPDLTAFKLKSAKTMKKPLLISTDLELISNIARYDAFKKAAYLKVPVIMLDCSLLYRQSLDVSLLFSSMSLCDQVMVGLWLENMIKRHTDFLGKPASSKDNVLFSKVGELSFNYNMSSFYEQEDKSTQACEISQIPVQQPELDNHDLQLAKFVAPRIGFPNVDEYIYAKQVLHLGCPDLIELVSDGSLNLCMASKIAKLEHEEQLERIGKKLDKLAKS